MERNNHHSRKSAASVPEEITAQESLMDINQLKRLVRLLDKSDVSEIELKRASEGLHLVLRKPVASQEETAVSVGLATVDSNLVSEVVEEPQVKVTATLVGLFHPWVKPKGKPVVMVGDRIKVGQTVATIESLNVLNEVESMVSGQVTEILVQDGQPVEYGQPLIVVDQSEED